MKYKAKILVVDDEIPICKSLTNILKKEGYSVDIALSGEEALKKEKGNNYAVMIVDLMMPGINGLELLEKVKKRSPDITVIMITGYPSIKTAVQSIKAGAFDFIPKPFTPKELFSLVSRALERRHMYEVMASKMGLEEKKLVKASIPPDLYCITENSWAKFEKDGNVRIGMHHILIRTIKDIKSIKLINLNETIYQGEPFMTITDSQNQYHRLWSPVTGKVIAINRDIEKGHTKLLTDPYEGGWLLLVEPESLDEDLKNLTHLTDD